MQTRKCARSWLLAIATIFLPYSVLAQHYQQTNLVSDVPGLAAVTDPDLVNAWGLTRTATSPWWVSDNGTGKATLYNGSGVKQGVIVIIPASAGSSNTGTPTGTVANGTTGFVVSKGAKSGAARFIFATEDGTISGWSPTVDATHAIPEVDTPTTAIYKGVTMATFEGAAYLYASNFKTGKVDVFNSTWQPATLPGGFVDTSLPAGYAPFGIQNINGNIFVGFAQQQGSGADEVDGKGLGYVDKFDSGGNLLLRLQHGPWMDAPWGLALAPANFGQFSNDVLVGNFGSGQIAAFDPTTGEFEGFLHGRKGPLVIDGLWAIAFGGGVPNNGDTNALFFTAGINDEEHGLFGKLTPLNRPGDDDPDE